MSGLGVVGRATGAVELMLGNLALRRLQYALLAALVGDGALLTASTVFAYGQGGAEAVGLFTASFMAASAVLASVGGAVADRFSRRATLVGCAAARIVFVAAAAVCLLLDKPIPVYVVAIAAGVLSAPFRLALRAWMPALARTPEELTASNAANSALESLGAFIGPAVGGLVLVLADVATTLWFTTGVLVVSLLVVLAVRQERASVPTGPTEGEGAGAQLVAGFRLLGGDADLRNIAAQVMGQTFVGGASRVFLVVVAVEIMRSGAKGIGLLDAIIGAGVIIGGAVALVRFGRQSLGRDMTLGVVLWSAPLGLIAVWPHPVAVVVALLLLGLANPLVDVNLDTIVQRMTPEHTLARAFGALDTCGIATKALGSVVAPVLLSLVGLRWTLVVVGLPVLAFALLSWRRMTRLDARLVPPAGLDLLRGIPWFALLGPAALEALARGLREVRLPGRTPVITEGEEGDAFYVIESGTLTVTQEGRFLREQGPGDYFGEIALLRQIPRTATVTASSDVVLRALDRATFLGALSGDGLTQAGVVAETRLRHTGLDD